MRESQRKKANAENAQAVKLLQKLEEEMNAEAAVLVVGAGTRRHH